MAYKILVTPNYYQGTSPAHQPSYLTYNDLHEYDIDGYAGSDCLNDYGIAEFETEEEAENIINEIQGDGPYYLSHGEAGAPSYEIVDDDNDDTDDCEDATKVLADNYFYEYKMIDSDDLPDGIQYALDGLNVNYYVSADDFDIYRDSYKDNNGNEYMIAFCPTSIAIQVNSEDLGNVDWDKPAYFAHIDND